MDVGIIFCLIFAFGSLILGFTLEGGAISSLLQLSAAIIVLGGTIGAVGVSFPMGIVKKLPKYLLIAFKNRKVNLEEKIEYFKKISMTTRREGLLCLESEFQNENLDPFTKKGLQMVVDGIEETMIRSVLENSMEQMSERHEAGIAVFNSAGGYAPTMGIIGTVMGLVQVVGNLSDPQSLGPKIASAFMATLYGISTANLFWLPIGNRLKMLNNQELAEKQMIIEAVILIQQGTNTNVLASKLNGYLDKEKEISNLDS